MSPRLEACGVSVHRGKHQVLHEVSLRLSSGELWGLVGPNGSGKSSFLDTLVGALPSSRGVVLFGDRPSRELSRAERARHVALVGRELSRDLALDVRSMVQLGRLPHGAGWSFSRKDGEAVERALREADCLHLAERPVFALSDGERQRVHWARALAQEPQVLLLDEATAHLDLAHRERTLTRVRKFVAEGGTALVVVHDLDLAVRHCSQLAVLSEGRIVATGDPHEALHPSLLSRVFRVDAQVDTHERGRSLRVFGVTS